MAEYTATYKFETIFDGLDDLEKSFDKINAKVQKLPQGFKEAKDEIGQLATEYKNSVYMEGGLENIDSLPARMQTAIVSSLKALKLGMNGLYDSLGEAIDGTKFGNDMGSAIKKQVAMITANMKTMFSAAGEVGSVMSTVPNAMRQEFSKEIVDMSRQVGTVLRSKINDRNSGPMSDKLLRETLMNNKGFSAGMANINKAYGLNSAQQQKLLNGLIKINVPSYARKDFTNMLIAQSRGSIKRIQDSKIPEYLKFQDRLPERFRNVVPDKIQRQSLKAISDKYGNDRLSDAEYNIIKKLASVNPSFEKALTMAGIASRQVYKNDNTGFGMAGTLVMPGRAIKRSALARAMGYLDADILRPALQGAPMWNEDNNDYKKANKQSRVPSEVYSAFETLKDIPGVEPAYTDKAGIQKIYGTRRGVAIKSSVQSRPDAYQINSYSWEDFKKGVDLNKAENVRRDGFVDEDKLPLPGSSIKMMNRNEYTDLLGIFGNNTTTDKIKQINMSDHFFKKDEKGNLVWKNGVPEKADEFDAIMREMYSNKIAMRDENGQIMRDPKGRVYTYPRVAFGGDEGQGYVPTNIKGGTITLAEEDAYVKASRDFIRKYGVNIFDNLADLDEEYSTVKGINKPIEARNRMLTPSIPIGELGGKVPETNKLAFVDLETLTGHNGASFFMPGYIPGHDATIRGMGLKGIGQSVDYKQFIKDYYGVDEFFIPAMNAPLEMKELFKNKGLEAVRKAYGNNIEGFNKDFLDIMKYEGLISSSTVKSPIYDGKDNTTIQNMWDDIAKLTGGVRIGQTAEQFESQQNSLSSQVAQHLVMSAEELETNQAAWQEHIDLLRTSEDYQVQKLFSNPNDVLSQRYAAAGDKAHDLLTKDPAFKERINDAIATATQAQMDRQLFAGEDKIGMHLALSNPFEQIERLAKMNGLKVAGKEGSKEYYERLAELGVLGLQWEKQDEDVNGDLWHQVAGHGLKGDISGDRFPNAMAEQFPLLANSEYAKLAQKYSAMGDYGVYMNMKTIEKMGGGDFDGDTVQTHQGKISQIIRETYKKRKEMLQNIDSTIQRQDTLPLDKPRKAQDSDFADLLHRQATAVFQMAAVNTAMNNIPQMDDKSDKWARIYGKGGLDLKRMYDIDSTFMKTGILANWSKEAQDLRSLGTPYSAIFHNLYGALKQFTSGKDGSQNIPDLANFNFPSIYNGLTVSSLNAAQNNPYSNEIANKLLGAYYTKYRVNEYLASNNPREKALGEYLKLQAQYKVNPFLGRGFVMDQDAQDELQLKLDAFKAYSTTDDTAFINKQTKILQHMRQYGITSENRDEGYGYATKGYLNNARNVNDSGLFLQGVDSAQDEMRMHMNMVAGANNQTMFEMNSLAQQSAIAIAKSKADARHYSWTNLKMFRQDPGEWYDRYISPDGSIKPKTEDATLGTAVHAAMQAWANHRMQTAKAGNEDFGTAEQFQKIFKDTLLEQRKGNKGTALFDEHVFNQLPNQNSPIYGKYMKALAFVRNLPQMLKDEQIVGTEVKLENNDLGFNAPLIGYKRFGKDTSALEVMGALDLVTRSRETGQLNVYDLKPRLSYEDVFKQLLFYNSTGNAKTMGVIGYADKQYDPNREETYIKRRSFDKAQADATIEEARNTVNQIQEFAAAGNPREALFNFVAPLLGFKDEMAGAQILDKIERRAEQEQQNKQRSQAYQADQRAAIDKKKFNAKGFVAQLNLQQDISRKTEQYNELAQKFMKNKFKYDEQKPFNQWEFNEKMLNTNAENSLAEFKGRGANDASLGELRNSINRAKNEFDDALLQAAPGDFARATELFTQKLQDAHGSSGVKAIAKEFDGVISTIEKAGQAYEFFRTKVLAKNANDRSQEENLALVNGFVEKQKMQKAANEYKNYLSEQSRGSIDASIQNLESQMTGRAATKEFKIDQGVLKFKSGLADAYEDLNKLEEKQIITAEEARQRRERLDNMDADKYRERLSKNLDDISKQQQNQENARIAMYNQQGDRLKLQASGVMRNDILFRAYRQNEQAKASYASYINQGEGLLLQEEQKLTTLQEGSEEYNNTAANINNLKSSLAAAREEMESFNGTSGMMNSVMTQIGNAVTNVATRLGRRLLTRAFAEAKKFIVEFDASMNEIQAITMKSDEDISGLGDSFIDLAKNMKVSVKDVTSVAGALYRQGLSDDEVNTRLQDVVKFSKVAGIKTTEATEIITTAMQNGLVNNSTEAMDSLVALGDSAATTADKIGKAMRKCAASANLAGVSYGELNSMLTIMTSMTQLSGQQVGTAVNTILTRMHNVTTSGYTKDLNGETTGINEVEKALKLAGISLREQDGTTWRSATDILLDVSKNWNSMSDIQRSNVSTALAATRGANMFTTLMEGMSEDNGETFAKYLGLSENSEGITDQKYEAMIDSITASMDKFKATYDGLVESMSNSSVISGTIDMASGLLQTLTQVNKIGPEAALGITMVGAALGLLALKLTAVNVASGPMGWIITLLSLAAGIATVGGIVGGIVNDINNSSETDAQKASATSKAYNESASDRINTYQKTIDKVEALGKKYNQLGEKMDAAETSELAGGLHDLISVFPELGAGIDDVSASLSKWAEIVSGAKNAITDMAKQSAETSQVLANIAAQKNWTKEYDEFIQKTKLPYDFTADDVSGLKDRTISAYTYDKEYLAEYSGWSENTIEDQLGLLTRSKVEEKYKDEIDNAVKQYIQDNTQLKQYTPLQAWQMFGSTTQVQSVLRKIRSGDYDSIPWKFKDAFRVLTQAGVNLDNLSSSKDFYDAIASNMYQKTVPNSREISEYRDKVINGYFPSGSTFGIKVGNARLDVGTGDYAQQLKFGILDNKELFSTFLRSRGEDTEFYATDSETNDLVEQMISYLAYTYKIKNQPSYGYATPQDFIDDFRHGFDGLRERNPEQFATLSDQLYGLLTSEDTFTSLFNSNTYGKDNINKEALSKYVEKYRVGASLMYDSVQLGLMREATMNAVLNTLKERGNGHILDEDMKDETLLAQLFSTEQKNYSSDRNKYLGGNLSNNTLSGLYSYGGVLYNSEQEAKDAVIESVLGPGSHKQEEVFEHINEITAAYDQITNGVGSKYDVNKQIGSIALSGSTNTISNKTNAISLLQLFNAAKTDKGTFGSSTEAFVKRADAAGLLLPWLYSDSNAAAVVSGLTSQNGSQYFSYDDIGNLLNGVISGETYFSDKWKKDTLNAAFNRAGNNNGKNENLDFMQMLASGTFGEEVDRESLQDMLIDPAMSLFIDTLTGSYSGLKQMLIDYANGVQITKERQHELYTEMAAQGVIANNKYGNSTEKVASNLKALSKQSSEATKALGSMLSETRSINNAMVAASRVRGKTGKQLNSKDKDMLAAATGVDKYDIEEMTKDQINALANAAQSGADQQFSELAGTIVQRFQTSMNEALSKGTVDLSNINFETMFADGKIDLAQIAEAAAQLGDEALATLAAAAGPVGTLIAEIVKNGNSVTANLVLSKAKGNSSGKYKGGGGGGGGGGKSEAQKLIEQLKRQIAVRSHRIKMIQYNETKYENAGELTNYDKALQAEQIAQEDLMDQLLINIDKLKAQLKQTKKGTDDWYALSEAILSAEEQYAEASNAVEDLTRKMHQNRIAILKTKIELEDLIAQEIQTRIEEQRKMVEGQSQAEQTIMDLIRQRYEREWELIKQGIDRKKEALEKEKEFLRESLEARKEAEDEAEKYEQLAEYRRQLAMIEMDPTRTKDAKELRKKIADIEKELAWDAMEDEVEAREKALDDEAAAMDDFTQYYEEDLNELLSNANNFAEEINHLLESQHDDLINWLKDNDEEYQHSLAATQETMVNSWSDTYKQMKGIVDTFWEEVIGIMTDEESFVEYMKKSSMFQNASDAQKEQYEIEWRDLFKTYIAANKDTTTVPDEDHAEDFESEGIENLPSTNGPSKKSLTDIATQAAKDAADKTISQEKINSVIANAAKINTSNAVNTGKELSTGETVKIPSGASGGFFDSLFDKLKISIDASNITKNASGGLVDYTGLTWVDGTPSKPEAFLSAEDTANMRALMSVLSSVKYTPYMTSIDQAMFGGASSRSIGQINVTITEAEFKEDADYAVVAKRVGEEFAKELSRNGFNTANYNF